VPTDFTSRDARRWRRRTAVTIKVDIQFSDKGEAARWLSKYYSRQYEQPRAVVEAWHAEFPHDAEQGVWCGVIEQAALAMLGREKP
jgi:hypothetical protein